LNTIGNQRNQNEGSLTFRAVSYEKGVNSISYGLTVENETINEGDFVSDLGFLSTSELRHFILGKMETGNRSKPNLKLAIVSFSGVPVAFHFDRAYSNQREKQLFEKDESNLSPEEKLSGRKPGQAKVLFARNTVFRVAKIQRNEDEDYVAVILEEHRGARPNEVKDLYSGKKIHLDTAVRL
jgi:hypothetical protein